MKTPTNNLPTAPKPEDLTLLLQQIEALTKELLSQPDAPLETLQACLNVRKTLVSQFLEQWHIQAPSEEFSASIQAKIGHIQALEDKLTVQWQNQQAQQANLLLQIRQGKKALSGYKVSDLPPTTGIENRG